MMNKRYTDIDALVAMLRNNIDLPFNGGDNWAHIVQIKDKLIEHIEKNAPVADVVEVVHGYNTYDRRYYSDMFCCSICGFDDWDTKTAINGEYNFCPNCGAKMDGKEQT